MNMRSPRRLRRPDCNPFHHSPPAPMPRRPLVVAPAALLPAAPWTAPLPSRAARLLSRASGSFRPAVAPLAPFPPFLRSRTLLRRRAWLLPLALSLLLAVLAVPPRPPSPPPLRHFFLVLLHRRCCHRDTGLFAVAFRCPSSLRGRCAAAAVVVRFAWTTRRSWYRPPSTARCPRPPPPGG